MKNRFAPFLVLLFILTLACNTLIGPTSTPAPPAILHFENDFVAFDYPEGMRVFNTTDPTFDPYPENIMGGQLIAALADPLEIDKWGHFRRTIRFFPPSQSIRIQLGAIHGDRVSSCP